ncbi:MAG: fructose-1,6-bisphosphatase [Lachnospiraceae bacterium]
MTYDEPKNPYYRYDQQEKCLKEDEPYTLPAEEQQIIDELRAAFINSHMLRKHVKFLYKKGDTYIYYISSLLFHGCIPMTENLQA